MPVSNILDKVHNELPLALWDHADSNLPVLKRQQREWIVQAINNVLKAAGYTDMEKWLSLYLTGSLTTYQYSPDSDCDVSLFVDTKVFPEWSRAEMIGVMVDKFDGKILPHTTFPMQGFVVAGGTRPEDIYEVGLRSAYDISNNRWFIPPDRSRAHDVEKWENGFYSYAQQMVDKMERLLRYEPDKAVDFWHQIHKKRQADQHKGKGDFTESNIIYKFLNNRGLFPQIAEASGEYIAKTADAPSEPPNYRKHEKPNEKCATCKMLDKGHCWGYGNKPVEAEAVCDSWSASSTLDK